MKRLAFVFPGQGSQALGMLRELAEHYPVVLQTFDEASKVLGFDLWKLCQEGPVALLNQTSNTQAAMLAAGIATWRVWRQCHGELPLLCAGHSLGEYTALVCAEAIAFNDAIKLVFERGRLMEQAVPPGLGGMAAIIGLDDSLIGKICSEISTGYVAPANYNAIGQTVIAGELVAVNDAVVKANELGAKIAKLIPVSVPSHCALMQPATVKFKSILESVRINQPTIPVIHNVDLSFAKHPDDIRLALQQQLVCPVRWVETIQLLVNEKITRLIECGPGKVLTALVKRIDAGLPCLPIVDTISLQKALEG